MKKAIVYDNGQGGVAIVYPVEGCGLTLEEIAAKDVPQGTRHKLVEVDTLDRTFRAAWAYDEAEAAHVRVDMTKAREIWKNKMREARKPKLEALDVDAMRAAEDNDAVKANAVKAKKKALRDVTADPRIEAAASPEQLKAVWPAVLEE